jgi:hypothetical protein
MSRSRQEPADPRSSVKAFAELYAELCDPFADTAEVLSAHGCAGAYPEIEAAWRARMEDVGGEAQETASAFADAYAARRERIARRRSGVDEPVDVEEGAEGPRFVGPAQPFRAEAAAVPLGATGDPVRPLVPVAGGSTPPWQERVERVAHVDTLQHAISSRAVAARDVDDTAEVRLADSLPPALPFAGSTSPELVSSLRAAGRAIAAPSGVAPGVDETLALPAVGRDPLEDSMPFLKAVAGDGTARSWTPEVYASLCAELAIHPEKVADILPRYALPDQAARRAVDRAWAARVQREPALRAEFERLYPLYREYLERRRTL